MWVAKTKIGTWQFRERYVDEMTGQTKTVSVTLPTKSRQNQKKASEILKQRILDATSYTGKHSKLSFEDLIEKFRDDQKLSVKKSTYNRNYHTAEKLKEVLGAKTLVAKMDAGFVREKFLKTGKSGGSLNEWLTRLKTILNWGFRNDYVDDVSWLMKIEPFKDQTAREKVQDKFLEREELAALLDATKEPHWYYLARFMALSGLRFGEAAALTWSDVDLDRNVIHVTKNYDYIHHETTSTKTMSSARDVYIQSELKAVLETARSYFKKRQVFLGYRTKLVFSDESGENFDISAFNKYMKAIGKEVVPDKKITSHIFRHTHASLLAEERVPLEVISRRLGHEDSSITKQIYIHITERLKEKDNALLESVSLIGDRVANDR